jgi:transcriptional regulator with XRE-family HTH domain
VDKNISNIPNIQGLFARRLKSLRLERKLSQERLGCSVGLEESVAATRINRYERGVHQPDLLMVSRLAAILEVPLPFFYADSDVDALILRKLYGLSDEQKNWVVNELTSVFTGVSTDT